jgi:heat shock protein HslJ
MRRLLAPIAVSVLSACTAPASKPAAAPQDPVPTLEAHRWSLASATDSQGKPLAAVSPGPGRAFVFNFTGPRLSIQGGCNPMTGSFQIDDQGQLAVGRMASTMMACEAATMRADAALTALLAKPMKIDLVKGAEPSLRLITVANDTLLLTGQMTPEARYGAPTLIFLEVAPQPVACNKPPIGNTTCLRVRERRYDAQGLVVGEPGEWRPLYEPIEGFTHVAGVRNVLRIKKFQRNPAPADASTNVYVLDLVVESEMVGRARARVRQTGAPPVLG